MKKLVNGVELDLTPAELAQRQIDADEAVQNKAARAAKRAARKAAMAETPASVNSVPALRRKVNAILQLLRGDL